MDWSAEAIERLRALWAEGHSTAEIGRRMGISKNAVVGKAHRLNLSARPSPIRRDAMPRPPSVARVSAPRAAPAPRPAAMPQRPVMAPAPAPVMKAPPPPQSMVRSFPSLAPRTMPRSGSQKACCWPIGEPGTAAFRFCAAASMAAKPYCEEHAALAYVKARDRREDAA